METIEGETAIRDSREADQRTHRLCIFSFIRTEAVPTQKSHRQGDGERFTGHHANTGRQPRGAKALLTARFPFHHCTPLIIKDSSRPHFGAQEPIGSWVQGSVAGKQSPPGPEGLAALASPRAQGQ